MKKMLILFVGLSMMLLTTNCEKDSQENYIPDISQKYDQFQDYFVLNYYPVNTDGNYLMLNSLSELKSIFQPATLMKKQSWISAESFTDKTAVTIIKNEYSNIQTLIIEKVSLQSGILLINYKTVASYSGYQGRPYLLIMMPRNQFNKVKFIENGKLVKTISK
jgi:hypothetical protein